MADRIPCINPRCRRTAAQNKFPESDEIICGKCFRSLPVELRRQHKAYWRRVGQLNRLFKRRDMQARLDQIARLGALNDRRGQRVWNAMHRFFMPTEKPAGIDTFLQEMGL